MPRSFLYGLIGQVGGGCDGKLGIGWREAKEGERERERERERDVYLLDGEKGSWV